jgi:hypothetical protein
MPGSEHDDNGPRRDVHPSLDDAEDQEQRGGDPSRHETEPSPSFPADDPNWEPHKPSGKTEEALKGLRPDKPRRRADEILPYLLVRAIPGDRGSRPLWPPVACWNSPDILLMQGGSGPFDPAVAVVSPTVEETYRVFVHVWNLGPAPAYGARVRVWWVEPGFFGGTGDPRYTPHFIGGRYLDLGDRTSGNAHRLVEVGRWTVIGNQEAHECLLAVLDSALDPWTGALNGNDRHVGQRNLTLLSGSQSLMALLRAFSERGPRQGRVEMRHAIATLAPAVVIAEQGEHLLTVKAGENLVAAVQEKFTKDLRAAAINKVLTGRTKPAQGQAHALTFEAFEGDEPMGGYTVLFRAR